jgi:hypothetical protein
MFVWLSIIAFAAVTILPAVLSGREDDWAHARYTGPLALPLVLILVLNRFLGPAPARRGKSRATFGSRVDPLQPGREDLSTVDEVPGPGGATLRRSPFGDRS